jgi:hypothetical protein
MTIRRCAEGRTFSAQGDRRRLSANNPYTTEKNIRSKRNSVRLTLMRPVEGAGGE